ncbi:MAG: GH3 auxin-responsive promoter family protein [Candidatus Sigynarchaeota archaeon]
MGVVEALVKIGLKPFLGYSRWALASPEKRQEQLLGEILRRHASTTFGKKHRFDDIRSLRSFQNHCKPRAYDYFKPYVDAMLEGNKHVLSNSKLVAFAHTTGTTGKPKLIPVTPEIVKTYSLALLRTAGHFVAEDPPRNARIVRGTWLYLPAPAIIRNAGDVPVGYITGLMALPSAARAWQYVIQSKYYTPLHLARFGMKMQFDVVTRECAGKNLTAVVGTTPVAVTLLEHMVRTRGASGIQDLFPSLRFGILSGVSPKYYEPRIRRILGRDFTFREVYAASEGMLAAQLSPQPGLTLLHDDVFFEFVPMTNPAERLLLHEVKKGIDYRLVITSHNGLFAYEIGDVVRFLNVDPPRIEVVSRTNAMDIAGEKVTPAQVLAAINAADAACRCKAVDFCVVGMYSPKARYVHAIEFDASKRPGSPMEYLSALDRELRRLNDVYEISRTRRILVEPELWILKPGFFHDFERGKMAGQAPACQLKTSRLVNDASILDLFEAHVIDRVELGKE